VSHSLRTLVGCAVLAAGLWAVTATAADAPDLPKDSYKKTAEADITFLKTRLGELAKAQAAGDKLLDGRIKPALGVTLLLSAYGDALGDAALKADALKVTEAIGKKDFKGANELAQKLSVKPGAGKAGALPKPLKDDEAMLAAIMSPFRGGSVGGLNIDKDIKDMTKAAGGAKIDPAAVEILAVRTTVINAYGFHSPNGKATVNAANQKKWEKYATESIDFGKQLTTEAAKGAKADEKSLKKLLSSVNARCTSCHNDFRDD